MKVPQILLSVVLFLLLFNLVVLLIAHSLQPLVGAILARFSFHIFAPYLLCQIKGCLLLCHYVE